MKHPIAIFALSLLVPSLLVLSLLAVTQAQASAGLSCEASDKTVKLNLEAGISSGAGSGFFSFKAEADILAPGTPKDFRKLEFVKNNLTQHWLDDRNLKLKIYREREGALHGYVDIVIEAWPRKGEEIEFRGGYVLTIFDIPKKDAEGKTITLKGRIACSVG